MRSLIKLLVVFIITVAVGLFMMYMLLLFRANGQLAYPLVGIMAGITWTLIYGITITGKD